MGIVVTQWKMMMPPPPVPVQIRATEVGDLHRESLRRFEDDRRELISLFHELDAAVQSGKSSRAIRLVLLALRSYAQEHFAAEEEVMEEIGYADFEAHVAEHREFAARVQNFTLAYEIGDTGISVEVVSYLCAWLDHHLSVTDCAFCAHLTRDRVQ